MCEAGAAAQMELGLFFLQDHKRAKNQKWYHKRATWYRRYGLYGWYSQKCNWSDTAIFRLNLF